MTDTPSICNAVSLPDGWSLDAHACLESTNQTAREVIEAGTAHEGLVICALEQTRGRGRGQRVWQSAPGNLFVSVIVRAPENLANASQMSFVTAVALSRALEAVAPGVEPLCKWPNDVLCAGGKIAGILLEMVTQRADRATNSKHWIILGIGVNLATAPQTDAPYPATSLAKLGHTVMIDAMLSALCRELNDWLTLWRRDGFAPVRHAWLDRAMGLGQRLIVRFSEERGLSGIFEGLDEDGRMILLTHPDQPAQKIAAGEVFFH